MNVFWKIFLHLFFLSGNLLDGPAVLQWMLAQIESDEIEEVTGTMLNRLIRESHHMVVLFCKYVGYAIIALSHTCYLLRHYSPEKHEAAKRFLPVDRIRGLAVES